MKLRHLLFGLLAGVAFVACTNDDDPASVSPVNGGNEVAATRSYISVNFVMPGNATTRAGETFEAGLDEENKVNNGVLFFFDGTTQVADPFEISGDSDWTKETPSEGNKYIEKKSPIIVVLENPIKKPTSVVAILNLGDKAALAKLEKPITRSTSLDELKAIVADYSKTTVGDGDKPEPNFVMTSSAYNEAENKIAAKIGPVYETREAAEGAPSVKIPVERVVAKVNVTANASYDTGSTMGEGESAVAIKARIDGWWLDNVASTSLLLKKIDTAPSFENWNDATNMRSYWANPVTGPLKHGMYSNVKKDMYVQENVNAQNPTRLVVAATLTDAQGNALPLVKFKGKLYTIEGFEKEVVAILASTFYTKTTQDDGTIKYASVNKDNVTITYDTKVEGAQYKAQVKLTYKKGAANVVLVKKSGATYGNPIDDFDADNSYDVQYWKNGQTYYFVPIKHNGDITGVIRNHVYKLKVNSVTGLGTPVPFTDEEIIPTIPETEKETFISCEIDILAWKVVEQNVELGK